MHQLYKLCALRRLFIQSVFIEKILAMQKKMPIIVSIFLKLSDAIENVINIVLYVIMHYQVWNFQVNLKISNSVPSNSINVFGV